MERSEGAGGMWPQGVLASSAAAMLGLGTGTQQQPVGDHPQYSLFQQLHGGGFQHHQHQPVSVPVPVPEGEHEEEVTGAGSGNDGGVPGPGFVWSRVKWTDAMVRLLIMVVYNAGPAAGDDDDDDAAEGRKAGPKKAGKWRSASQAMVESGFAVSPQQCEDKFNDLNKRYKRVVELLGKGRGRACAVLQNPALLEDAMDKLPPAARELARKLLGPKQLFGFREMCVYHNHLTAAGAASQPPKPVKTKSAAALPTINEVEDEEDEQRSNGRPNPKRRRGESSKAKEVAEEEEEAEEDDPDETDEDEDAPLFSAMAVPQLQSKLDAIPAGGGDLEEARRWLHRRAKEVQEKLKACDRRDKELHEHRMKWERFREAKEREMDLEELQNIRARRKLLVLKEKELDRRMSVAIVERQSAQASQQQQQKKKQKQAGSGSSVGGQPN